MNLQQPALAPIVRRTSTQAAVDRMLDMLRSGVWRVGDRLPPEKELAEQLGVGRSTIREALQNLAAINIIESGAGLRTVVKSPTPQEIFRSDLLGLLIGDRMATELVEARAMIEPDCAKLAVERAGPDGFGAVADVLRRHAVALEAGEDVHTFGAEFHLEVVRCARNRVAEMFMQSILDLLKARGRLADTVPDARLRELRDHQALLDVLRAGDPEAARLAMLNHILDWAQTFAAPVLRD